jgi:hypothetical protein
LPAEESEGEDEEDDDDDDEETTEQLPEPTEDLAKTTRTVTKPPKVQRFLAGIGDLTTEQENLLRELYLANGQDAYDAEAAAVGRLKQEEYLAIPEGMLIPRVAAKDVGSGHLRDSFSAKNLAAIYYLNKSRSPAGEDAVAYGMIRMEAIKCGWLAGQKEVVVVAFDKWADAMKMFVTDLATVRDKLATFKLAAFLIPLVCEHTFRTMGHHYLSGMATEYQTRYRKTLKACLALEILDLAQPATLFHHLLHWVSPERSFNVLHAQLMTNTLPDAIVIRASSAPAGWAIVTTTDAVIKAMKSANVYDPISKEFGVDLDNIENAAIMIRAHVRKWHKAYFAYGVAPPDPADMAVVDSAKDVAIAFAPYAQGFIDGTLKDAALGQAMALKKHADLNPVAKTRAARFFRNLARAQVTTVSGLFRSSLKESADSDDDEPIVV